LKKYAPELEKKKEYIFLTKTDLVSEKDKEKKIKELRKINPDVLSLSVYDDESLEKVKELFFEIKNGLGIK